jgi:hypothetical protein
MFQPDASAFAAFSTPHECHKAASVLSTRSPGKGMALNFLDPSIKPSPQYPFSLSYLII